MANNCYVEEGYADIGYFLCDTSNSLVLTPSTIEKPKFIEKKVSNYRGVPGVKLGITKSQKSQNKYNFVTSIIIESEKGTPNTPIYINNISEFNNEYGNIITKETKYALSFLYYSPSLLVTRVLGDNSFNSSTENFQRIRIDNFEEFTEMSEDVFLDSASIRFIAQTPGKEGNLLAVSLFTTEELKNNKIIHMNYKAQDIIKGMDDMCYCIAVFKDDVSGRPDLTELKEIFVVPFNDVESINTQSEYVYCRINAYNNYLDDIYDGNQTRYNGNLLYNDGNGGKYFYGYDGNIELIDGVLGFYDGNVFNQILFIDKFYDDTIMNLVNGESEKATPDNINDAAEILDNKMDYNIDLHIGINSILTRSDCVNIVGTPKGIIQAIDFKMVMDSQTKRSKNPNNIFYIYGIKSLDNEEMNCSADYAGLRSKDILTNGLGRSTSKITTPLSVPRLKTNPSLGDIDKLYQNGINIVRKYNNIIYCNGEVIHGENI